MSEAHDSDFGATLRRRVADARASLTEAQAAGDDYQVQLSLGEIESFARLATDHQIVLDGVDEWLAPYRPA